MRNSKFKHTYNNVTYYYCASYHKAYFNDDDGESINYFNLDFDDTLAGFIGAVKKHVNKIEANKSVKHWHPRVTMTEMPY